jgi:hypothetical protein
MRIAYCVSLAIRGAQRCAIVLCLASVSVSQQPVIQITSPADGTVVTTGQQFAISVSTAPGTSFSQVVVIGQKYAVSPALNSPPFTFSFTAPTTGGPLVLTAVGFQSSGSPQFSQPVVITVESGAPVTGLKVAPSQMSFGFAGQQLPLTVTATFADGSTSDVTSSAGTTYSSSDNRVAQVSSGGIVTAVGVGSAGSTQITVTLGPLSGTVRVGVPVTIRGDLNGDGKVDRDDLNIILTALNTPASKPVDARDLNGDGVIDTSDAKILVSLCTRPWCSTSSGNPFSTTSGKQPPPQTNVSKSKSLQIYRLPMP